MPGHPRANAKTTRPGARRGAEHLALLAAASLLCPTLHAKGPAALDIREIRVEGVQSLPGTEVERLMEPHLGPSRTVDDVERARLALEEAYRKKGYETVSVTLPAQRVDSGVVVLRVEEGRVGRLRVRGAKYHEPDAVKAAAPSLAEGKVPNFNEVRRDIVALQSSDRRVTPSMKPGVEPGTIDVDLDVEDKSPLHGSLEVNNRYNRNTNPLRLNGALHYDNLWQAGHSVGFSFQSETNPRTDTATPLNRDSKPSSGTGKILPDDTQVYSGFYTIPRVGADWLSLQLSATKQSSLNTGSGLNILGDGVIAGLRLIAEPGTDGAWRHTLSAGFDYKRFKNDITINGVVVDAPPIEYLPFSADYSAVRLGEDGSSTQGSLGLTWHLRGLGGKEANFEANRAESSGGFFYLRSDLSHTEKLPEDWEFFGRAHAQVSPLPLVPNEQFGLGGQNTVRGYLESEAMGDLGISLSTELRTPSFTLGDSLDEWRLYLFGDCGSAFVLRAGAGQDSRYELASAGIGSRMRFAEHFSATVEAGVPLTDGPYTDKFETRVGFSLRAEF